MNNTLNTLDADGLQRFLPDGWIGQASSPCESLQGIGRCERHTESAGRRLAHCTAGETGNPL